MRKIFIKIRTVIDITIKNKECLGITNPYR